MPWGGVAPRSRRRCRLQGVPVGTLPLLLAHVNCLLTYVFGLLRYVLLFTFVARTIPTYASDIILYAFSPSSNIFLPTAVRRLQEQGTSALTFVLQPFFFCCEYISFRS